MPRILRTGIVGEDMMDVHLDNGHILMIDLSSLLIMPDFSHLREDDRILYPKTDGISVYWRDGPSLSVDKLFLLMQSGVKGEG